MLLKHPDPDTKDLGRAINEFKDAFIVQRVQIMMIFNEPEPPRCTIEYGDDVGNTGNCEEIRHEVPWAEYQANKRGWDGRKEAHERRVREWAESMRTI
jgi:hypothetical protein